jgi:hypothetical protein
VYEFETLIISKIWASQAKNSRAKHVIIGAMIHVGTVILKVDNALFWNRFKKSFFPNFEAFLRKSASLSENLKMSALLSEFLFFY